MWAALALAALVMVLCVVRDGFNAGVFEGNLVGAVDQLELASKAKDGDFYEISSTEARLREMKTAFRNRTLLPGEKKDPERDKKEFSAR